jgi:hypothetical protein
LTDPDRSRLDLEALKSNWLRLSSEQRATLLKLSRDLAELGPRACRVLELQAERLAMGAKQYGDFTDKRNWRAECLAEYLDATAYLACAVLEENK